MAVKIVELLGVSDKSWEAAVQEAVSKAGESIRNVHGVDVKGFSATVKDGKISEYRANVKIAFGVE